MSIATDLIAGFPGETCQDQQASVDLIRRLRADTVNITRFSARPGTPAFALPQLNGRILKDRSTELTAAKNDTEASVNAGLIGKQFRALVTETGEPGSVIVADRQLPADRPAWQSAARNLRRGRGHWLPRNISDREAYRPTNRNFIMGVGNSPPAVP